MHTTRPAAAVSLLALALLVLGCNSDAVSPTAGYDSTIDGTITLDGTPLDMGMVIFEKDGKSASSTITEGGKLLNDGGVPSGKVKAKVNTEMYAFMAGRGRNKAANPAAKGGGGGPAGPPGEYRPVPKKYSDFATSGLEFDLKPGPNTLTIELKSK